VTANS